MTKALDEEFAAICAWLKQYGMETHTYRSGTRIIRRRRKRSRLTGEWR
jgi:hypothetical protein